MEDPLSILARTRGGASSSTSMPTSGGAAPTSGFEDLLAQQKMNLLKNLGQPSGWNQVGRGFDLLAAGAMGGEQFLNQRNAQAAQDINRQNILQSFIGNEQTMKAQAARLAYDKHKAAGDELTAYIGQLTQEDPVGLSNFLLDAAPIFRAYAQKLGITEDDIPPTIGKQIAEAVFASNPEKYGVQPQSREVARPATPEESAQFGGKPVAVTERINPDGTKEITGYKSMGPLVQMGDIGTTKFESSFGQTSGKLAAETLDESMKSGAAAQDRRAIYPVMQEANQNGEFVPGPFGPTRLWISRLAQLLGVDIGNDTWKRLFGRSASGETLDAMANQLALDMETKGRRTNLQLGMVVNALPSLLKSKEGNAIVLEIFDKLDSRDEEIGKLSEEFYRKGTLTPPGEKSYYERMRQIKTDNPVLTPELRKRITSASRGAPISFNDVMAKFQNLAEKEGVAPNSEYLGQFPDENGVYHSTWRQPDGRVVIVE